MKKDSRLGKCSSRFEIKTFLNQYENHFGLKLGGWGLPLIESAFISAVKVCA